MSSISMKSMNSIKIQTENFSVEQELVEMQKMQKVHRKSSGAIVSFIGLVRDFNQEGSLQSIYLDCYQEMAYKQIEHIIHEAIDLYHLDGIKIIHRIGNIEAGEQIVLVLVSSTHRKEAFEGCSFIMDTLKSRVPLFKAEIDTNGNKIWLKSI